MFTILANLFYKYNFMRTVPFTFEKGKSFGKIEAITFWGNAKGKEASGSIANGLLELVNSTLVKVSALCQACWKH